MVTRSGTAKASVGDTVSAGDVLIEGRVDVYGEDEAVKNTHYVRADGDICARVTWHCDDYYPAWYIQKNFTKSKKYQADFEVFGKLFSLGRAELPGENAEDAYSYDEVTQTTKYRLTKNFYLPFCIHIKTVRQYTPEKIYYTEEQLAALGAQAIEKKLLDLEKDGAKILSQNLQVVTGQETYAIRGDIEMIIPIGKFTPATSTPEPETSESVSPEEE